MGWTFTPGGKAVEFRFEEEATNVMADGNNIAWACQRRVGEEEIRCSSPILFVYMQGRRGSGPQNLVQCPQCEAKYYLKPAWSAPTTDASVAPGNPMTIEEDYE